MRGWVCGIVSVTIAVMAASTNGADAAPVYEVTGSGMVGTPEDFLDYNVDISWSQPDFIKGDTVIPQASLQCSNTGGYICDSPVTISSKAGLEELTFTLFHPKFGDLTIDSLFALSAFTKDGVTVGSPVLFPTATLTVTGQPDVAATPLPSSWTMMLIAIAGLGFAARRRRA